MLSRFHLILKRYRRTDGQTDGQTDLLYQYRASVGLMLTRDKIRVPKMKKTLRICITVSTEYRRVSDRQTNGQTSCHFIVRAMDTSRAVKKYKNRF